METITAEEAAQNLLEMITRAQQDNQQFRITTADQGAVILLSEETYENLMVTLEVLSTPGLMNGLKLLQQPSESCHQSE